MTDKLAALFKNLLLMAVAILVSLIIAELAIRTFVPQLLYRFPKGMFTADTTLGFRPTPGFEGLMRGPEYKTHILINSKGLRDREYSLKSPNTFRILALGDSFTMGNNVALEETYPKVLEKILNGDTEGFRYEVINAGVAGYGTQQELNYLRTEGLRYSPDLILVGFYAGNDVENNMKPHKLTVEKGYLVARKRKRGLLPLDIRHFLARQSHLYAFLWDKYNGVLIQLGVKRKAKTPHFIEVLSRKYTSEFQSGWEKTFRLLSEINEVSKSHGAKTTIVVIPSRFQVYDVLLTKALSKLNLNGEDYDLERPSRILQEFGKENNVPVLDLLPSLRVQDPTKPLYHLLDGHWNEWGNSLVAREIHNFLVTYNLLRQG